MREEEIDTTDLEEEFSNLEENGLPVPRPPLAVHPWVMLSLLRRLNWHAEQLKHEKTHFETAGAGARAALLVLRRMDERRALHEAQELREVELARDLTSSIRDMWGRGEASSLCGNTGGANLEDLERAPASEQLELLIPSHSGGLSPVEGFVSWKDIESDLCEKCKESLVQEPFLHSNRDYLRQVLSAYLQCVLRVAPCAMSPQARDILSLAGLPLASHPLGLPIAAFVLAFRDLFSGAAQDAAIQLGLVGSNGNSSGNASGHELPSHVALSLKRAVKLTCQFCLLLKGWIVDHWSWLRGRLEEGPSLVTEAIIGAVTVQLPELCILFMALNRDSEIRVLQMAQQMTGGAHIAGHSLMEELGVPQSFRLCETRDEPSPSSMDKSSQSSYEPVISALEDIERQSDPISKVESSRLAVRAVALCVTKFWKSKSEKLGRSTLPSVSTDALLPIISFCIISGYMCGRLKHLKGNLDYAGAFLPSRLKIGEWGFCLTLLQSALLSLLVQRTQVRA